MRPPVGASGHPVAGRPRLDGHWRSLAGNTRPLAPGRNARAAGTVPAATWLTRSDRRARRGGSPCGSPETDLRPCCCARPVQGSFAAPQDLVLCSMKKPTASPISWLSLARVRKKSRVLMRPA